MNACQCGWCGEYVPSQTYDRGFDACDPCVAILTEIPRDPWPDEPDPMDGMEDPRLGNERFLAELAQSGGTSCQGS